ARAREGGHRHSRPHARTRHARGPVLPPHRGRRGPRSRSRRSRPQPRCGRRRSLTIRPGARMSAASSAPPIGAASPRAHRPRTLTVWRWELRKLVSQKRTYLGFALAVALPLIFVIVQNLRETHDHGRGGDSIFTAQITQSGLATPVLMLLFLSVFMLPLIAAL